MASPRSIEVKVGLLILAALVLLAAFILVMGGINLEPAYEVVVGFDNPGGLQSGAPVKIAGVKVGKVEHIQFNPGTLPEPCKDTTVLVTVSLEKRYEKSYRHSSIFYVTTQGVLGEQFLAIDPGSPDSPVLKEGECARGLDPPRLDRLMAETYDLLHTAVTAMRENRPQIGELFDGLAKTLKGTGELFERNQDRIDRIAENLELVTEEGVKTVQATREKYVENPAVDRIITSLDRLAATSARDVPVLLQQGRTTLESTNTLVSAFASDAEIARIKAMLDDLQAAAHDARLAVADAKAISGHIRRGQGSVGALVMDEQLFDDLQELARDLKHNPWKFFWRE
jgi:phospholipid/cholesterol/gamma-HCH transport system substrate-binding protein